LSIDINFSIEKFMKRSGAAQNKKKAKEQTGARLKARGKKI
jgi:hypothetical protein